MHSVITTQNIGDIAAQSLAAVRVFEKHGIDYCCGGQRPLHAVCLEKGIDPEALLVEIETAGQAGRESARDWSTAPLTELIAHIVSAHHAYLRRELPLIEQRMAAVLRAHGERYGDFLRPLSAVIAGLRAELVSHMGKEEQILFPYVANAEKTVRAGAPLTPPPFGSVRNPIRMMEHEHDSASHALGQIRRLTGSYSLPDGACNTFRALYAGLAELERDLHLHIHLENNILFPRAVAIETGASQKG